MATLIRVDSIERRSRHIVCTRSIRLGLFLLAAGWANAATSDQVVGRWRSLKTSKGGIGAIYEFRPNGDVDYSPGAIVASSFRVEGDQLWIHDSSSGGSEQKLKIKWIGEDKFRLEPESKSKGETKRSELTRKGQRADPKNPIVGEWTGTQDMRERKLAVLWLFHPDGKSLFLMPFAPQRGHYKVQKSTIRIELPIGTIIRTFEINDDVLTFADPSGPGQARLARY
jgi:hypothetical protein